MRAIPLLVVAALGLTACGGDDSSATTSPSSAPGTSAPGTSTPESVAPDATSPAATVTTDPTVESTTTTADTTTTSPAVDTTTDTTEGSATPTTAASEPGPYPVGVTTRTLPAGNLVEIWYPAADGVVGTDTYDVRELVPDAIRSLLTADLPAGATIPAARDADPADAPPGGFPLVAYSHGFAGFRTISSLTTSHLASWGMVVVAPDHPSRDLFSQLGGAPVADTDAADDLRAAIELVVAESAPGGTWDGLVDPERLGLLGHSAGGGTILAIAGTDDRVDGYVSMASGRLQDESEPMPDVPSFFIAGSADAIVSAEESTRPAFEDAPAPSRYWELEGVGHNGFDDLCTFGDGAGLVGIAEASGLGPLLEAQPGFRTLGEDGCLPPATPVEESFPLLHHGVTTWLLDLFDSAGELSTDLGPAVGELYGVGLTVDSKP